MLRDFMVRKVNGMPIGTAISIERTDPRKQGWRLFWLATIFLMSHIVVADENRHEVSQVIAHRGASAERPENTLESLTHAILVGATAVEVDVRTTRDRQLVLMHDATLDRTTNGTGAVNVTDFQAIRKLDAGSWFDESYRDVRVPTLAQALVAGKGRIDILLDLKESGPEFAASVAGEVSRYGNTNRIIVGVRSIQQSREFRRLLPKARQLGLIAKPAEIEAYAECGVETIRLWPTWLTDESLVPRVRQSGAKLHLNGTDGHIEETARLLMHEPDSMSSDSPQTLIRSLRQHGITVPARRRPNESRMR